MTALVFDVAGLSGNIEISSSHSLVAGPLCRQIALQRGNALSTNGRASGRSQSMDSNRLTPKSGDSQSRESLGPRIPLQNLVYTWNITLNGVSACASSPRALLMEDYATHCLKLIISSSDKTNIYTSKS